jgi:hypothetical protein
MAISENNSSSAELNAKSLEIQIISKKYEQNIAKITHKGESQRTVDLHNKVSMHNLYVCRYFPKWPSKTSKLV